MNSVLPATTASPTGSIPSSISAGEKQKLSRPSNGPLTSQQKAALVIAALAPNVAGPVIEGIGDKHLRAFARAYAQLETVPKPVLQHVVKEFISGINTNSHDIKGGFDETRALLNQFISTDHITRLMEDIDAPGAQTVWEKLERTNEEAFSQYLSKQNPQLIAVVLSKISTEKASRILDQIDLGLAGQVIIRLSKPLTSNRDALIKLSKTIERDFLAPLRTKSTARKPGEMIGAMMNNIMSEKREELINLITSSVPEILSDVKKSMLTFQDLTERVPPKAIPMAIKEVEVIDFLKAMKYGKKNAPDCVEYIFKNISQRMAKQYEEQMAEMVEVSVKEAEAAQADFMSVIRGLVANGEVELIDVQLENEDEESPAE